MISGPAMDGDVKKLSDVIPGSTLLATDGIETDADAETLAVLYPWVFSEDAYPEERTLDEVGKTTT